MFRLVVLPCFDLCRSNSFLGQKNAFCANHGLHYKKQGIHTLCDNLWFACVIHGLCRMNSAQYRFVQSMDIVATLFAHRCSIYSRCKKSSHLPSVQWDGQYRSVSIPFPLISVRLPFLSVFKLFPFCPKGSPSVQVNDPDGEIKRAQSNSTKRLATVQ